MRNIWCGHESPKWNEKPIRVDDKKCGKKPPLRRLCDIADCKQKCHKNKTHRTIRSDVLKCFEMLAQSLAMNNDNNNDDSGKQINENRAEIENLSGSDEKLPNDIHDNVVKSQTMKYNIIHPLIARHPFVNHRHRGRSIDDQQQQHKLMRGELVIDKMPIEHKFIEEIPILEHHEYDKISDDVYRKLGDKVHVYEYY
jgi:hypothetical protein